MVKSNLFRAASTVFACVLASAAAHAGGNRSGDSVCADLIGSEYAACHTYCEALQCGSEEQAASPKACDRALQRFLELSDGVQPPCLESGNDHGQVMGCPCSFGWRDPDFFPADWDVNASSCMVVEPAGGRYIALSLVDSDGNEAYTELSFSDVETSSIVGASFYCYWGGNKEDVLTSGEIQFGDSVAPPGEVDSTRYQDVMAACEAELTEILGEIGFDLAACQ